MKHNHLTQSPYKKYYQNYRTPVSKWKRRWVFHDNPQQKKAWQRRLDRIRKRVTHSWNKFGVTITFTRRNTFVNLGYTEYLSKMRLSHKQRKIKNLRGKFTRTLTYVSAGLCGLNGSKKAAPMANITIAERVAYKIKKLGHNNKHLRCRIFGSGRRRRELMRGLIRNCGLVFHSLKNETKIPHNGVKHKKLRRK